MLLSKRSKQVYLQDLLDIIYANNQKINGERHSVIDDIFLQPASTTLSYLHSVLFYLDQLHVLEADSIENDVQLLEDLKSFFSLTDAELTARIKEDFNRLAASYGLTRVDGTEARGYVRFFSPVADPLSIPAGTQVATKTDLVVVFETVSEVSNQTPEYDSTRGLYYVDVGVICTTVGTSGNLQQNRLTVLLTTINGVTAVTNTLATTNGTNAEANSALVSRIRVRRAGRGIPTRLGYNNLVLGSGFALDSYVASKVSDPTLVKRDEANPVDIFVVTSPRITAATEIIKKTAASYYYQQRFVTGSKESYPLLNDPTQITFVLGKQPVTRIVSVSADGTPLSSSNYSLSKDLSNYSKSKRAFDKVVITGLGGINYLTVKYEYDATLHELQNLIEAEENDVVNSNVLIRLGSEISIDFDITLDVVSGYSVSTIQGNIEADLQKFFAGGETSYGETFTAKVFGFRVDRSDLYRVALNVAGVDRINNDNFIVSYAGITVANSLELEKVQFPRIGTVTWI